MKRGDLVVLGAVFALGLLTVGLWIAGCGAAPCAVHFVDSYSSGTPNLEKFGGGHVQGAPMWRMGQPPNDVAWNDLQVEIGNPLPADVVVVKLNDEREGSDDYAAKFLGWTVLKHPLAPEDDKPWTVLAVPSRADVDAAVDDILAAHARGATVLWHCVHGRDRTSLVAALVGRKLLGWTKDGGWNDMLAHGYRWELPGLDVFWSESARR